MSIAKFFKITSKMQLVSAVLVLITAFSFPHFASASALRKSANMTGLLSYWSLNDGAGTLATDFSGNGHTGALTNGPTWVNGKYAKALSFDGSNDYVDAGDFADSLGEMTASAWIKRTNTGSYEGIVTKNNNSSSGAGWGLFFGTPATQSVITFFTQAAGGANYNQVKTSTSGFNDGNWHFVLATLTGGLNGTITIYVDGVSQPLTGGSPGGVGSNATTEHVWIGGTAGDAKFNGLIDEVRIYNRALGATEVAALYASGLAKVNSSQNTRGPQNGLVGEWSFDGADVSGTTAYDRSGSGNNGTLTNGPTIAIGKIGQALSFDGVNDYVSVANGGGLNNLGTGSISMWVKWSGSQDLGNGVYGGVTSRQNNGVFSNQIIGLDGADPATAHIVWLPYGLSVALTGSTPVGAARWRHVVITYTSGSHTLYLDGVSDGTGSAAGAPQNDSSVALSLGAWNGDGGSYSASLVDDVRVYNRILTSAEVSQLYNLGGVKLNSSQNTHGPQTGLVGLWSLNGPDVSGTTAYDRSGNGFNGTLTNGPTIAIGKMGQALQFDGVDDYVGISDNVSLRLATSLTAAAWFKTTDANDDRGIFRKDDTTGSRYLWGVILNVGGDGKAYGQYYNGVNFQVGSLAAVNDNKWHHAVLTISGTTLEFYIDGVSQGTTTITGTQGAPTGGLDIGAEPPYFGGGRSHFLNGSVDDFRVYSRALSATEVLRLYNLGK